MLSALKALIPPPLKKALKDLREDLKRRRPKPIRGDERFGLVAGQIYPDGCNFDGTLKTGMAEKLKGLTIGRDTPVASIGSCFAEEFAAHMREAGYNYVMTEPDLMAASANWGRVYTLPCLRQIAAYTADDFPLAVEPSKKGWFDPLRDTATPHYPTREAAEAAIRGHRAASRKAIEQARVLTVTLGQNEAWRDKESGLVWARIPPKETAQAKPGRFEPVEFAFEQDLAELKEALRLFRTVNPALKFLLTVSPVAAHATFLDPDVVTRSFAGKCLLRAVAERAVRETPDCWYFPSFEIVLAYNPHAFNADNRHVKRATVDRIFGMLRELVVR